MSKLKLKTFGDFVKHLWQTFSHLSRGCSRLDIIFDLYIEQSIKEHERERRSKTDGINTEINRRDQPLPVDMNRFWSSTTNKVRLQQFFINWVCDNYKDQRPVYLGGSHENDLSACLKVTDGRGNYVCLLKCDHKEADDRIMLHVNHAVIVDQFRKIIIASADTDVFICLMYHFRRWNELDLRNFGL